MTLFDWHLNQKKDQFSVGRYFEKHQQLIFSLCMFYKTKKHRIENMKTSDEEIVGIYSHSLQELLLSFSFEHTVRSKKTKELWFIVCE